MSSRVRNLATGRVFWVPDDHFSLTQPNEYEVVTDAFQEEASTDFHSWSANDLTVFAAENGIDVGRASSVATLAARIEAALASRG